MNISYTLLDSLKKSLLSNLVLCTNVYIHTSRERFVTNFKNVIQGIFFLSFYRHSKGLTAFRSELDSPGLKYTDI